MRYRFKLSEFIHHPIKAEVLKELKWKHTDTLILDTIKHGMDVSIVIKRDK